MDGAVTGAQLDQPDHVSCGDLDGDGDLDLLASNFGGLDLTLLMQTEPGQFTIPVGGTLPTFGAAFATAVADLDGDGDLDIAAAAGGLVPAIYLQDDTQPGTFALSANQLTPDAQATFTRFVLAEDLNGDGRTDLLVLDTLNGGTLFGFVQSDTQPGTFALDANGPMQFGIDGTTTLTLADVDADGDLDIVMPRPDQRRGSHRATDGCSLGALRARSEPSDLDGREHLSPAGRDRRPGR